MLARLHIPKAAVIWLVSLMNTVPVFACWQVGHGYDKVRADHLTFGYANHGKPVKGARFEVHKANWADGASDDQSNVPQGPARTARWRDSVLSAGSTNERGIVDLGAISPGKYYVVAVKVSSGKKEEVQGFPIEVLVSFPTQKSQTLWLNYYADGCTEILAVDPAELPRFTN